MDVGDIRDHQELVDYLDHEGIKRITYIFLTNWSKENMSGLVPLMNQFPGAQIYVPDATSSYYAIPVDLPVQKFKAGDHLTFSDKYGISLDILTPLSPVFHDAYNDSLVTLLHYQKIKVLFNSDNCEQVIKDAANSYSQEWSDFFFIPIGKNLKINFNDGVYTTPKNQLE